MKIKINFYLLLIILLCFGMSAGAEQNMLWPDNAGLDPATGSGWDIEEGTLEGWQDSNFETLEYQAQGKSEEVGTGITVEGIKVDWDYPGSGNIGKGEDASDFNQSIDYTVVAFAEIPCVLKMNVFGNGGWAEGISVGYDSEVLVNNGLYMNGEENGEVAPGNKSHFMIFDPDYGGVVDGNWNYFKDGLDAKTYTDSSTGKNIFASDMWTVAVWGNIPYGFTVSCAGLSNGEQVLDLEMRYLMDIVIPIGDPNQGNVVPLDDEDLIGWSTEYILNTTSQSVEIGQFSAGSSCHINMQFRVPLNGARAGIYSGEVCFSTYTI